MDKLEKVLAAEEAARHTVAEAKERAAAIRADADVRARDIATRTVADARAKASAERDRVMSAAGARAAELTARAQEERAAALEGASGRVDAGVETVVRALKG